MIQGFHSVATGLYVLVAAAVIAKVYFWNDLRRWWAALWDGQRARELRQIRRMWELGAQGIDG